jgi:hypothetical protein
MSGYGPNRPRPHGATPPLRYLSLRLNILRSSQPKAIDAVQRTANAVTNTQKDAGMPGFLEPIWETIFRVATWSALIFGALSIGSAFVSAWVGWEITDATQKDADKKIKAADERIADAGERAARLEREAAGLRLELDREVQKRAQRILTDEQKSAISEELRGKISEIAIVVQHDPEARSFAVQIMSALQDLKIYGPEPPREDRWFAPAGLIMFSPLGSNEDQLKHDPLYLALKRAGLFGGTTSKPFLSPDIRGPAPQLITGYSGHVLYVGQKFPF